MGFFDDVKSGIDGAVSTAGDTISGVTDPVTRTVSDTWTGATSTVDRTAGGFLDGLSGFGSAVTETGGSVTSGVTDTIGGAVDGVTDTIGGLGSGAGNVVSDIGGGLAATFQGAVDAGQAVVRAPGKALGTAKILMYAIIAIVAFMVISD